mgnify:FL=1
MKKISVIIPVYNGEKYIEGCINSILQQTYPDYEIIIVNDGSSDNTENVCRHIKNSNEDKDIRIINKKNGGSASARNVGLTYVRGEVIAFVDADDYIDKNYFDIMIHYYESYNADIVQCNFQMTNNRKNVYEKYPSGNFKIKSVQEMFIDFCYRKTYVKTVVLWNKLFNKQLFDNVLIKEGKSIDDEYIILNLISKSNRIIDIDDKLYYYYQSENSQMRSKYSVQKIKDGVELIDYQVPLLMSNLPNEYFGVYCYRISRGLMRDKYFLRKDICEYEALYHMVTDYIKKYLPQAIKCKHLPLLEKIFLLIQYLFPGVVSKLKG